MFKRWCERGNSLQIRTYHKFVNVINLKMNGTDSTLRLIAGFTSSGYQKVPLLQLYEPVLENFLKCRIRTDTDEKVKSRFTLFL